MEKERKLLASDYDYTYNMDILTILYNRWRIKKFIEHGNLFVFSTMRNFDDLKYDIDKHDLPYDYLSLCGGRIVVNKNGEIIFKRVLGNEKIDMIWNVLREYKDEIEVRFMNGLDWDFGADSVRMTVNIMNPFIKKELVERISKLNDIEVVDSFGYFNILSANVDKKDSIDFISEIEEIKKENIWTVGDSMRDLTMIKEFNGYTSIFGSHECKKNALGIVLYVGNLATSIDYGYARKRKL